MYKIWAICILISNLFGAWVMFNDGADTYIYNNLNGDIFIRHRGDGENYEDRFIKMPAGVIPPNLQNKNNTNQTNNRANLQSNQANKSNQSTNQSNQNPQIQKEQVDALEKRFQELENNLLNKALE